MKYVDNGKGWVCNGMMKWNDLWRGANETENKAIRMLIVVR